MKGERTIFHCDCNGFYASVECLDNPSLSDVPTAVAGDPEQRTGIILAKNELAKQFGVQTAETVWQAQRKCPDLVLVPPRHARYAEVSRQVNSIYAQYTDRVEPFGIDESFLDVSALVSDETEAVRLADQLRARIRHEIGITISVGISFNKVFAKLGSDMKKPDATTLISRQNYREKVWMLSADSLLYVGRQTSQMLKKSGIQTIGDLAALSRAEAEALLGKHGGVLWVYANGLDDEPVRTIEEVRAELPKSVGNGRTFAHDLCDMQEVRAALLPLSEEVTARMRKLRVKCWGIQVQIKSPTLKSISRQTTLSCPTALQRELLETGMRLIAQNWRAGEPIRALTLTATGVIPEREAMVQMSLFDTSEKNRQRQERLERTVFQLREKYGRDAIRMGLAQDDI